MVKRSITELAVYHIDEERDILPFECIYNLYLEKTSEIVYIVKDHKLYGIVCMGEILYGHKQNSSVKINKNFTKLRGFNVIDAHEIFQSRRSINKIPVVDEQEKLIGDYSRWDDMLYIKRNQERLMQKEFVKNVLEPYESVYVVEPIEKDSYGYMCLKNYLNIFNVDFSVLDKTQICGKLAEKSICIFLDEDERRGMQCFYRLEPQEYNYRSYDNKFRFDKLNDIKWRLRFATYKGLLSQIMQEKQLERLKIEKPDNFAYDAIDDKITVLLSELQRRNITCFYLSYYANKDSEYSKKWLDSISQRISRNPLNENRMWPESVEKDEFYSDLYELEDYKNGTAQYEINSAVGSLGLKKEITGKYFNLREGKRVTCYQPEKYIGTIYIFGPCLMLGVFVEDQYTIASYLQKKLLERGYAYRVENYAQMFRRDACVDSRLDEIGRFQENDIVVVYSPNGEAFGIQGNSLEEIFEKFEIPYEWVTDGYTHCNHKANEMIAEGIMDMIFPSLLNQKLAGRSDRNVEISIHDIMQEYIQQKYLKQYFFEFPYKKYNKIGAVVMNCNPFSKGHRHVVEFAIKQVEFLIVFVVEEDSALFPFDERFELVKEGVREFDNILVVPSGDFIISQDNFHQYFSKVEDDTLKINAEYDINIFADYIAKPLGITHRFAGEEPEDNVTRAYNNAMKKILPEKGITFVEIPRITIGDEIISASKIRKYLKEENYEKAFSMLPETTRQYLLQQI